MLSGLESPMHLLVILAIALIVLGPKRLPEAGRGMGAAIRNFRESIASPEHDEEPPPPAIERSERPDL
jgi:sec-independent protein translocase protein TatA